MAYNKSGYNVRARLIKSITAEHYERENHSRCLKAVWRRHIRDRFGIGYRAYLNYLKVPGVDAERKTYGQPPIF